MAPAIGSGSPAAARVVTARQGTIAAFCASLVGIGLARFAYTPLLPALVDAHWFTSSKAAYLGAANLIGYLVGALMGRALAERYTTPRTLKGMMLLATAAFFACAHPISFAWFFVWRVLAGVSGGALMVLAAPSVLPFVRPARRGLAGGVIFMGVGLGIVASGTVVPLLLESGVGQAWIGLGVISLLLTAASWKGWPQDGPKAEQHHNHTSAAARALPLRALYFEYALNAAGWVPHMIFLVDFVAHGLGKGLRVGAEYWVIFGVGATIGPVLAGLLADKIGFAKAIRLAFVLEIIAVALPALTTTPVWLVASSLVVGAFVTGTVPLVLGRIHELLAHHPSQHGPAWRKATVGFAVAQAIAAYGLSFVFSQTDGNYALLFVVGTAVMVVALALDVAANRMTPRNT